MKKSSAVLVFLTNYVFFGSSHELRGDCRAAAMSQMWFSCLRGLGPCGFGRWAKEKPTVDCLFQIFFIN